MQLELTDEKAQKYAHAYMLFMNAKDAIEKEANYQEGLSLLHEMYAMIGEDGLAKLSYLNSLLGGSRFTPHDYYETLCLTFIKLNDYEQALVYTQQWKKMVEAEYGMESVEMVNCLKGLGKLAMMDVWVERELEDEYNRSGSIMALFRFMRRLASPFHQMQRKLQIAEPFYQKGYDILKKIKGLNAPETLQHKRDYIQFMCHEVVKAHVEESLWTLTLMGPLMVIVILAVFGFTLKSFVVLVGLFLSYTLWRIISLFFYYYLTERHYEYL